MAWTVPVIGAHTMGYNSEAFAMSAIGDFSTATPPAAVVSAYQRLFAWKFAIHGVNPRKPVLYGGKAYNAILGHRTSTGPSARASACTTCCRRSAPAPSPAWAAAPRRSAVPDDRRRR